MILVATGHRSERIENARALRESVRGTLTEARPEIVVCGMANGFDLIVGHAACNYGFEVWAAKPWAGHGPRKEDEAVYNAVIMFAAKVVDVDPSMEYAGPWVYQKRNEWMVDHGTHILSYWDGKKKGGTWNCLNYNMGLGDKRRPVRNLYGK